VSDERPDLSEFTNLNKTQRGKRMPWDRRVALIQERFPSVLTLDWRRAFDEDLDLFADIMRDILKADAAEPGRSGPKPSVGLREGLERFRHLVHEDFSMLTFTESFAVLVGDLSLTAVARKTGLSRAKVHRLLRGTESPSPYEMEQIAHGFKKAPGYFADYRIALILNAMQERFLMAPESTVKWYVQLVKSKAA
jgi:AraC-like DNA-binding protein